MYNHSSLVTHLATSTSPMLSVQSTPRTKSPPDPSLLNSFRSEASLQHEAEKLARASFRKHIFQLSTAPLSPIEPISATPTNEADKTPPAPEKPKSPLTQWVAILTSVRGKHIPAVWESHHVLSAIDRQDAETLMRIRDDAFHLLLQNTGFNETPLKYAMRVQPGMGIILLGAFSRYINSLEDSDLTQPGTRSTLRHLRQILYSAIMHGLANSQKDLIASFLQTLVMAEGDNWVQDTTDDVARALKQGPSGRPVWTAQAAIRRFAANAMKGREDLPAVEDYVANAASDLLMMAAWASACRSIGGTRIPICFFARDDRVYREFVAELNAHLGELDTKVAPRLRQQLELLREGFQGRRLSNKQKLEALSKHLDEGKS